MVQRLWYEHSETGCGHRCPQWLSLCRGRFQWKLTSQHSGKVIEIFYYINVNSHFLSRYDPKSNQWTYVAPMQVKRKHLGVAVIDNYLYSVGGRDENFELSSVER